MLSIIIHSINLYSILIFIILILNNLRYKEKKYKVFNRIAIVISGLILLTVFISFYLTSKVKPSDFFLFVSCFLCAGSIGVMLVYINMQNKIVDTDYLTGAYNRRFLDNYLAEKISYCKKNNRTFACILIDLDKFKNTNDIYGHDTGDEILKTIATLLKKCLISKKDFVARFGGDEFYIILNTNNIDQLQSVVCKIKKEVQEHNSSAMASHKISYSIGFALYDNRHDDCKGFQKYIDELMYNDKKSKYI